mgnify:CR=1 FL=1
MLRDFLRNPSKSAVIPKFQFYQTVSNLSSSIDLFGFSFWILHLGYSRFPPFSAINLKFSGTQN